MAAVTLVFNPSIGVVACIQCEQILSGTRSELDDHISTHAQVRLEGLGDQLNRWLHMFAERQARTWSRDEDPTEWEFPDPVLQFPELPRSWKPYCGGCKRVFDTKQDIKSHWGATCTRGQASNNPVQQLTILLSAEYAETTTLTVRLDPTAHQPLRSPYAFMVNPVDNATWAVKIRNPTSDDVAVVAQVRPRASLYSPFRLSESSPAEMNTSAPYSEACMDWLKLIQLPTGMDGMDPSLSDDEDAVENLHQTAAHEQPVDDENSTATLQPDSADVPLADDVHENSQIMVEQAVEKIDEEIERNNTAVEQVEDMPHEADNGLVPASASDDKDSDYLYHYALSDLVARDAMLCMANTSLRCMVCHALRRMDTHSLAECLNPDAIKLHHVAVTLSTFLSIAAVPDHTHRCCLFPKWLVAEHSVSPEGQCVYYGLVMISYKTAGMSAMREERANRWFDPRPPLSTQSDFSWMLRSCYIEPCGPCTAIFLYSVVCQWAIRVGPVPWTPPVYNMRVDEPEKPETFPRLEFSIPDSFVSRILNPRPAEEITFGPREVRVRAAVDNNSVMEALEEDAAVPVADENAPDPAAELAPPPDMPDPLAQLDPAPNSVEPEQPQSVPKRARKAAEEEPVQPKKTRRVAAGAEVIDLTKTAPTLEGKPVVDLTKPKKKAPQRKEIVDLTVEKKTSRKKPSNGKVVIVDEKMVKQAPARQKAKVKVAARDPSPLPQIVGERALMPPAMQSEIAPLYRYISENRMHLNCKLYTATEERTGRYKLRYTQHWTPAFDKLILSIIAYMESYSRDCSICMVSEQFIPITTAWTTSKKPKPEHHKTANCQLAPFCLPANDPLYPLWQQHATIRVRQCSHCGMPEVLFPKLPSGFATHDPNSCDRIHWQELAFSAFVRNPVLARLLCKELITKEELPNEPAVLFQYLQVLDDRLTLRISMNLPRCYVLLVLIVAYRHFPQLFRDCYCGRFHFELFEGVEKRPPRKTAHPL